MNGHRPLHPLVSAIDQLARDGMRLRDVKLVADDNYHCIDEWHQPENRLQRSFENFGRLVSIALDNMRADARDAEAIMSELGLSADRSSSRRVPLANVQVREQGYRLLFDQLSDQWHGAPNTTRRWFFGTLLTDMGNALEYAPVIEMHRLKRDFAKIIARTKLNAFAFIEIQAATNYPQGGAGRTLMTHAHFIGYTDDTGFDLKKTVADALACKILTNWLGAPTFDLKPILHQNRLREICAYLFKMPYRGSWLQPNRTQATGFRTAYADVRPNLALRLAEVLVQLDYRQITFSTGEGKHLKTAWLRALSAWDRTTSATQGPDVPTAIRRCWLNATRLQNRGSFDVRWSTELEPPDAWNRAMQDWFQRVEINRAQHTKYQAARRTLRSDGLVFDEI